MFLIAVHSGRWATDNTDTNLNTYIYMNSRENPFPPDCKNRSRT